MTPGGRPWSGASARTRADCLAAVAAYVAEAAGQNLHPGLVGYERLAKQRAWPSRTTITLRLGRWSEALAAAGYGDDSVLATRRRQCLAAVGAYVAEIDGSGRYPARVGYTVRARSRGWPAAQVIREILGTWPEALAAVGFAVPDPGSGCIIGRETCLAAMACHVAEAARLGRYPGVHLYRSMSKARGWPTSETVVARLGSWADALAAAGFEAPRGLAHRVDRERCVEAVAAYLAQAAASGAPVTASAYGREASAHGWPARSTVSRRLGSWRQAVAAAGPAVLGVAAMARGLILI